jgi:hypothetical protein
VSIAGIDPVESIDDRYDRFTAIINGT